MGTVETLIMSILTSAADVGNESSESDDEFQICEICNGEEVNVLNSQAFAGWLVFHVY